MRNTAGDVSESIRNRIQELWNRRLAVGAEAPGEHKAELRTFGVTFASGKLDPAWAVSNLEIAVELAGAPRLGRWVVERLAAIAETAPAVASRILAAMLAHPEREWDYVGWRDEARTIVSVAARSDDPQVTESCAAIVDYYVKRGELDFRDLLRSTEL